LLKPIVVVSYSVPHCGDGLHKDNSKSGVGILWGVWGICTVVFALSSLFPNFR